ncbi:MAG: transposase zinc-binding domain-containing protein [Clostridia bacterium]|nr:transposase zinc-binding domain-containing protein [Deltaproteobacteria bacterium]
MVATAALPEMYERRRLETTAVYQCVQEHLESFPARLAPASLPKVIGRELERFLTCRILEHGFARVRCSGCGFDRLVALAHRTQKNGPENSYPLVPRHSRCGSDALTDQDKVDTVCIPDAIGGLMPGLLIKNLPPSLHRRLRVSAKTNHRSLSSEALNIIEEALDERAGPPALEEVDALRQTGARPLTDKLISKARTEGLR